MKPLSIVLISLGIILSIGWFLIKTLATVISLTKLIWPFVAVFVAVIIVIGIRKWFDEQAKALWEIILFKKIFQAALLAVLVYLPLFCFSYGWLTSKLIESTGFSYHHILIIVTILQLPIISVLYFLFSRIWPEKGKVMRGFLIISLVGPVVIAYIVYMNPYWYFDHQTGKNKIWVSDTEKRIYHSPGYGIEDGKPLRPGTAEDTKKLKEKKESFRDFIEGRFKKWSKKEAQAKQVRRLSGIFKLPKNKQVINQDTKGRELWYLEEEYVRFQQLGSPGKFTVVNIKPAHQSWTTDRRVVTVGPTKYSDKIRLMAAGEKEIIVQVWIIPRRS